MMQNRATAEQFNALMQCEPLKQEEVHEITFLKPPYQEERERRQSLEYRREQQRRQLEYKRQQRADSAEKVVLCIVSMLVGVALGVGL